MLQLYTKTKSFLILGGFLFLKDVLQLNAVFYELAELLQAFFCAVVPFHRIIKAHAVVVLVVLGEHPAGRKIDIHGSGGIIKVFGTDPLVQLQPQHKAALGLGNLSIVGKIRFYGTLELQVVGIKLIAEHTQVMVVTSVFQKISNDVGIERRTAHRLHELLAYDLVLELSRSNPAHAIAGR